MKYLTQLPLLFGILFSIQLSAQTVTDIDGNVYNIVTINNAQWLKENLRVKHFNNGDPISNITNNTVWLNLTTPALSYYNNDSITNDTLYGLLYNGYVVTDSRNVCPVNWHVATETDWNQMCYYIDPMVDTTALNVYTGNMIGTKLKHPSHNYWFYSTPTYAGTDDYGFSALPGGVRSASDGYCGGMNNYGNWWTSDAISSTGIYIRFLFADDPRITRTQRNVVNGYSIRCVKDPVQSGIQENLDQKIQLYPNPAQNTLYVQGNPIMQKVIIYNMMGQIERSFNNVSSIDVSGLLSGFYQVSIIVDNAVHTTVFIKE